MRSGISFLLLLIVCFLSSCDSNRIYETNHDFEDRTWKVNQAPEFEFKIDDPGKKYNLYFNVRNSLDYPYSRIFVNYHLQDSIGNDLQSKLITHDLFDEKTGAPLGSSGLGDLYDHQFVLLSNYDFKFPGKYKVKLEQYTRQDTLKGMLAVGVRVETAQPAE
jgi:gliding motility-associated lipoprotein GldH